MKLPQKKKRPRSGIKEDGQPPWENAKHRQWVRQALRCLASGSVALQADAQGSLRTVGLGGDCEGPIVAAHVRLGLPHGARKGSMGRRPGDEWVIPLCDKHHKIQHTGERTFAELRQLDLVGQAETLARHSPHLEEYRQWRRENVDQN